MPSMALQVPGKLQRNTRFDADVMAPRAALVRSTGELRFSTLKNACLCQLWRKLFAIVNLLV